MTKKLFEYNYMLWSKTKLRGKGSTDRDISQVYNDSKLKR